MAMLDNAFLWRTVGYDRAADAFFLDRALDTGSSFGCSAPLSIGWIITGRCNLKCVHCYGNQEELPENELSAADAMSVARRIVQEGIRRVSISGGEPMLRADLPDLVDYLSDNGVSVIVSTNGLSVSEKLPALKKLRHIETSLDGDTEALHDFIRPARVGGKSVSFANAVAWMKAAVGMGIRTRVLTTLNVFNYRHLEGIGRIVSESGAHEWHIGRTTNAGRARFRYGELMNGVEFDEAKLAELRSLFPSLAIQFNYPSKTSKYYALVLPDWQMATQDYRTGEKISLWSLVDHPISAFWTPENYDMEGHYFKWLNIDPNSR